MNSGEDTELRRILAGRSRNPIRINRHSVDPDEFLRLARETQSPQYKGPLVRITPCLSARFYTLRTPKGAELRKEHPIGAMQFQTFEEAARFLIDHGIETFQVSLRLD